MADDTDNPVAQLLQQRYGQGYRNPGVEGDSDVFNTGDILRGMQEAGTAPRQVASGLRGIGDLVAPTNAPARDFPSAFTRRGAKESWDTIRRILAGAAGTTADWASRTPADPEQGHAASFTPQQALAPPGAGFFNPAKVAESNAMTPVDWLRAKYMTMRDRNYPGHESIIDYGNFLRPAHPVLGVPDQHLETTLTPARRIDLDTLRDQESWRGLSGDPEAAARAQQLTEGVDLNPPRMPGNTNTPLQINNPAMDAFIDKQWNDLVAKHNKPDLKVIEGDLPPLSKEDYGAYKAMRNAGTDYRGVLAAANPLLERMRDQYGFTVMQPGLPKDAETLSRALLETSRGLSLLGLKDPRTYPAFGIYYGKPRLQWFEDGYSGTSGLAVPNNVTGEALADFVRPRIFGKKDPALFADNSKNPVGTMANALLDQRGQDLASGKRALYADSALYHPDERAAASGANPAYADALRQWRFAQPPTFLNAQTNNPVSSILSQYSDRKDKD